MVTGVAHLQALPQSVPAEGTGHDALAFTAEAHLGICSCKQSAF
jgi:hypothetical protein